jgi:beta-lactamase regulating signal transducer with metallopeptidase domain
MNSFIQTMNDWGGNFLNFAWPMLWQSSLLIVAVFAFDFLFRRKVRGSIRYTLWLVVLVKLCVPPTLALPTSPAWWLHQTPPPVVAKPEAHYTVTYDNAPLPEVPQTSLPVFVPPKPAMNLTAWSLVLSVSISSALFLWLLVRWWQITRQVRHAAVSGRLNIIAAAAQEFIGMRFNVRVKLTANSMSPAVCGLFRPAILIPQSLADNFSDEQLRAVLLHELVHLCRRDVWVNFLQALLQILYWWHPLVWLANARIRRVREEAVDDAVMLALRDQADSYAPTLLEVAKLALNRPLASLGLVGILESRHALRQRIERLVDFRPPRRAGLTLISLLGILAFTAVAVPMGEGPDKVVEQAKPQTAEPKVPWPDPNVKGYQSIDLQAQFLIVDESELRTGVPSLANDGKPTLISRDEAEVLLTRLKQGGARFYNGYPDGICQPVISGAPQSYRIGGGTNQGGMVACLTTNVGGDFTNILAGFDIQMPATQPDWTPMNLTVRALAQKDGTHFQMSLSFPIAGNNLQQTDIMVPYGKAIAWTLNPPNVKGKCQIVLLIPSGKPDEAKANSSNPNFSNALVQNGNVFYEMGKLDEAEAKFNAALALEPENATAEYYLGLVQAARQNPKPVQPGLGRKKIVARLNQIKLDHFGPFDGFTLDQVVNYLRGAIRQQDTNQDDFRLTIVPGSAASPPQSPATDASSVIINLPSELESVRLADALDAIVTHASRPIEYAILDDGVVFSEESMTDSGPLFTRRFRVDVNFFASALRNATGLQTNNVPTMAKNLFSKLGVDLDLPGKAVFFNVGVGELSVRATLPDLDTIQHAIQALNLVAPQIHIKARFLEVPQGTVASLGNFLNATNSAANQFTGILNATNLNFILHSLESRKDVETLSEPEVTTTSGRQTQMRGTTIITVVTDYVYQASLSNRWGAVYPQTGQFETGPVLDLIPYVLADGHTINLTIIPSLTEFLGYATPPNIPNVVGANNRVQLPVILPQFSTRQMTANLNLWDGQTVVVGGMSMKNITKDNTPVLGSVPLLGRMFRSQHTNETEILVFVTATLVDSAGNRVHSDEEMSVARAGVPPQ